MPIPAIPLLSIPAPAPAVCIYEVLTDMALILASQSPRRKELLGLFHIPFTVRVADIDETMDPQASAYDEVARLSREKAMAVSREPEDTVISINEKINKLNCLLVSNNSSAEAKHICVIVKSCHFSRK